MTREEFIEVLDREGYSYEIVGDKIVVTHDGYISFPLLKTLPSGVEFRNTWHAFFPSLNNIPPGVKFNNEGNIDLDSLVSGRFHGWNGVIKGIKPNELLNKMIEDGLFDRR